MVAAPLCCCMEFLFSFNTASVSQSRAEPPQHKSCSVPRSKHVCSAGPVMQLQPHKRLYCWLYQVLAAFYTLGVNSRFKKIKCVHNDITLSVCFIYLYVCVSMIHSCVILLHKHLQQLKSSPPHTHKVSDLGYRTPSLLPETWPTSNLFYKTLHMGLTVL